jgi:hypothetical protein
VATALVRSTIGKSRPSALAGLTLAAAALTACLGPNLSPTPVPSPTPTARPTSGISAVPTSIDPCGLLTIEQASAVNGVPYKGGEAQKLSNGISVCSWDNAAARATVEVRFSFWPSAAVARAAYDAALTGGSAVTPVAGLADAAIIIRQTSAPIPSSTSSAETASVPGEGNIFVRRDALFFTVGYYNGSTPTDAALKAAALLVLGKLPQVAR